ncbi:hypothetical protein CEXT_356971 [Caerostris extrusa]|uniref:Uncharacterized protein n=1 Tax=Caerostris extrusa TaxID=172846 RepID=A0AAV4REN7_CAEEX|nr:hypothetical protein CEXT_356971 [Caerostris extrusa]
MLETRFLQLARHSCPPTIIQTWSFPDCHLFSLMHHAFSMNYQKAIARYQKKKTCNEVEAKRYNACKITVSLETRWTEKTWPPKPTERCPSVTSLPPNLRRSWRRRNPLAHRQNNAEVQDPLLFVHWGSCCRNPFHRRVCQEKTRAFCNVSGFCPHRPDVHLHLHETAHRLHRRLLQQAEGHHMHADCHQRGVHVLATGDSSIRTGHTRRSLICKELLP